MAPGTGPPADKEIAMGEHFWYGLGIVASFSAGAFAVVWMSAH
ncbi:hypothetical protein ACWCPD_16185 [Streptomyces sp. NPDC001935]